MIVTLLNIQRLHKHTQSMVRWCFINGTFHAQTLHNAYKVQITIALAVCKNFKHTKLPM